MSNAGGNGSFKIHCSATATKSFSEAQNKRRNKKIRVIHHHPSALTDDAFFAQASLHKPPRAKAKVASIIFVLAFRVRTIVCLILARSRQSAPPVTTAAVLASESQSQSSSC